MPGVSGPREVSGAGGYGKVQLRFRKIDKSSKKRVGAYLFLFGFSCLLFKTFWGFPNVRRDVLTPAIQAAMTAVDCIRLYAYEIIEGKPIFSLSSEKEFLLTDQGSVHNLGNASDKHISLRRDALSGFTHIYASSLSQATFAQGYAHASDRMGQMDMRRRLAKGTLSEVCDDVNCYIIA